jgi:very-short-patch-repair endonuclease
LAAGLTAEQLEQCKSALRQQLQQRRDQQLRNPTKFQQQVCAVLSQLPNVQRSSLKQEVLVDGLVLVDMVADTLDGYKLAVEADGAPHFCHPNNQLTGSTLYRNQALAARGYVVVSIKFSDWPYGSSPRAWRARQVQLQGLVEEALKLAFAARSTAQ